MKRRTACTAAALSAVLLTGCQSYGTDIPAEYKDFWDYTFQGSYSVVQTEKRVLNEDTQYAQGYRRWEVTYTDKRGVSHIAELTGLELIDHEKELYHTQEWYDVFQALDFVTAQMGAIAQDTLWEEILSDDLDVQYERGEVIHKGEDCTLAVMIHDTYYTFDEAGYAYAKQKLSPQDGYCIADCDLTSVLQDDEFILVLVLSIDEDADAAQYEEKLRAIEQELLTYTGGVQNYQLVLKQGDGSAADPVVYEHAVCLGEDFVPDPAVESDSLAKAVQRHWEEKYE